MAYVAPPQAADHSAAMLRNGHVAQANAWKQADRWKEDAGGWHHPATGDRWNGALRVDFPAGLGEYVFADSQLRVDAHISGETRASLVFSGKGSMKWPDGSSYTGALVDSAFHGHGEFRWACCDVYCGEWVRAKRHGTGVFTSDHGGYHGAQARAHSSRYSGEWADDEMHGEGCIEFFDRAASAPDTEDVSMPLALRRFTGQFKRGFPTEGSLMAGQGAFCVLALLACERACVPECASSMCILTPTNVQVSTSTYWQLGVACLTYDSLVS